MALTNGEFGRPFVPHPQHDNILVAHGWHAGWDDKQMMATMISMIQQQQKDIEALKARVAALEAK